MSLELIVTPDAEDDIRVAGAWYTIQDSPPRQHDHRRNPSFFGFYSKGSAASVIPLNIAWTERGGASKSTSNSCVKLVQFGA